MTAPVEIDDAAEAVPARTPAVIKLLVAATFVVILNETIMINAIPQLMVDFDIEPRTAQWLSSIFMLVMAAIIPVTGWFLQRVSTRTAYSVAMTTFIAGTLLAALAPSFAVLLVARAVQAAGTAVMMPLLMTTLMQVVDPRDRGRVMGDVMLAISVAPAFGPVVSGLLLKIPGWGPIDAWRWVFIFVLPVALLISTLGLRRLENIGEQQAGKVSWLSVVLAGFGFSTLVYGLSEVGRLAAWELTGIIGTGALMVALFIGYQLVLQRSDSPLLDLRALRFTTFTVALLLMCAAFMAFIGSMILLPMYLQQVRGLSAMETGLLVMPGGLAMGLLGPRVGHLYDKIGSRPLVIPGSIVMVVVLFALSRISIDTPYWLMLIEHIVLMVSLAAIFTPVFTLGLGVLPPHLYSHGSSILGTFQQVAGAVGTAALVVIMENRARHLAVGGADPAHAFVGGFQGALVAAAVIGMAVIAFSLFLPSKTDQPAGHH